MSPTVCLTLILLLGQLVQSEPKQTNAELTKSGLTKGAQSGSSQATSDVVDFDSDIIALLTKSGCNAGACHGAAAGRGGMHLSLLGADPEADYDMITRDLEGRRVNLLRPSRSLILRKPTEDLSHGGGQALDEQGEKLLERWISQGAKRGSRRKLTELKVSPEGDKAILDQPVNIQVVAVFDDKSRRDVTQWTTFSASDAGAVELQGNRVIPHLAGRHTIIARYLSQVVPMTITVPFALSGDAREQAAWSAPALKSNFIDQQISQTLDQLNIRPTQDAADEQWLRRVTLALTGRLPTERQLKVLDQTTADQNNAAKDREHQDLFYHKAKFNLATREKLVDELLASEAFVDYWTFRISKILRLHSLTNEPQAHRVFAAWIRNQVKQDAGWDSMIKELLLATGDSHIHGAANFARMVGDARGHAELIGQSFAGVQLGCANCHNHPLDRWTQDDYHGLAAILAPLERGKVVKFSNRGQVTNPRTHEPAVPRIPGQAYLSAQEDNRARVVDWLLQSDQQILAKAMVNRLWQTMFGRGLVDPVDDLRNTNPATHPELLSLLANDFSQHGFKIRHTLKQIALSSAFSRSASSSSTSSNVHLEYLAARRYVKLEPEVLLDAIDQVTSADDSGTTIASEVDPTVEGNDRDTGSVVHELAIKYLDPLEPNEALDQLGRCRRVDGCRDAASSQTGLAVELHLLNGATLNAKIASADRALHRMIKAGQPDSQIIKYFYRTALSRSPSSMEAETWNQRLAEIKDVQQRTAMLEDFLWALLNSREFTHNH